MRLMISLGRGAFAALGADDDRDAMFKLSAISNVSQEDSIERSLGELQYSLS